MSISKSNKSNYIVHARFQIYNQDMYFVTIGQIDCMPRAVKQ